MHRRWRWLVPFAALLAPACLGTAAEAHTIPGPAAKRIDRAAQLATVTALVARKERARARIEARAGEADDVVARAKAQIGDGYAYGAGGPDAFDCSGLTRYAFAAVDVALAHSSHAQASEGRRVDRAGIRPGDLVFFSTAGAGASHVGVATSRSTAVSATNSGVLEHPIGDAYWGGHYVTARRVL